MLKTGDQKEIANLFQRCDGEARSLIEEIIKIAYFMRGAIQYNDLLENRTFGERKLMSDFIVDRLNTESKSMSPVY